MRFTIVKNMGTNQPQQLSYDFMPPGGTIGRSPDNHWVLPDEGQAIARLQATVSVSIDGECRITNRGAASDILLNTIPIAPDRKIEICDGDTLNIGDYQIQVININQGANNANAPPLATIRKDIPNEIWDGLENTFTPDERMPQTPQQFAKELNDNHPLIKPQPQQERNPINPLEQMETMIDLDSLQLRATDPITMFNANTDIQQENILNDSTPSTLLQQGNQRDKQEIDPLILFSDKHLRGIKHDEPLNLVMDNAESLVALDNTGTSDHQYDAKDPPFHSNTNNERLNIDPMTYPPNPHQPDQVEEGIKLEGKLLAALLDGMGLNHLQNLQFDEHTLYKLGKLLSQLSQGIIALNASRTQLKYEIDTEVVQVLVDGNNPFALLPSGQAVLIQMLGDPMPGFMSAEQATRDILIELQAHQLGMIAGLRTITTDILQRFDPLIIKQKAQETGSLPRLALSSTYKASLWDYFIKHYQKTMEKIEQDHSVFGEHFRQSYESEIIRYKHSQDKLKNKDKK
ncbi:type VI secretion system-associated FHA domain protein [Xenorhabdus kozodoii]|uniref:Putative FHA domain protein n=1 Tax=Xenorhabdus kozodoii TaxID=351676 RepID=A0A2D0L9X1_9GAMM|nr:type VI secretion system-associated FHA domain protein [Xenorhabdus kozodoii]PHM72494.1 putative FHA domain protein [Xenorhabdus kozodoii]